MINKEDKWKTTTCARKRPVPYYRPSPPSPSSISSDDSYYRYRKSRKGSRYRSLSRSVPLRRKRSWSRTSDWLIEIIRLSCCLSSACICVKLWFYAIIYVLNSVQIVRLILETIIYSRSNKFTFSMIYIWNNKF